MVDLCENDEEAEPTNTWLAVEKDEEKADQVCEEKGTTMTFDLELGVLKDQQWIESIAPLKASPFSEDLCWAIPSRAEPEHLYQTQWK